MTVTAPPDKSLTIPAYPIWRFSVAQYHDMIRAGILTEDDPVELLEGWLVTKMPKKPRHSFTNDLIVDTLRAMLPSGWSIRAQEPITTADSEPEPDIAVVRGDRRDYAERHPAPEDVALVVEVADATLQCDRTLKLRVYASARVPAYWILNLPERQLEVYGDPAGTEEQAAYRQQAIYHEGDSVPVVIAGQEIGRLAVRDLLG